MSNTFKKGRRKVHRDPNWWVRETAVIPKRRHYRGELRKVLRGLDPEEVVILHDRKPKSWYW